MQADSYGTLGDDCGLGLGAYTASAARATRRSAERPALQRRRRLILI